MNKTHWKRAADLFDRIVDLDSVERERILEQECAGDDALKSRVASLLERDESEGQFDTDAVQTGVSFSLEQPQDGAMIGPFRLIRQLGSGGMGVVYLAERADGEFEHRVAIKLLRQGLDDTRFHTERRILAQLQHPNIARLLDGGTFEDERPYVVMEYIEGQPIDRFCDDNNLGISQRLRLFMTLCHAVQHAHQNLIVHRDLKPGNVLIDASGTLKLLDFGIAKLLGDDRVQTQTDSRLLTPAYASPEQLMGQPISTASDVYSLGVVLYELLCGCRPFAAYETQPREFEKAVLERIPNSPSRACLKTGKPKSEARERYPWSRSLRGDLDIIVMKALGTNPEKRYSSVGELVEDLDRYKDGRPITARRAGPLYRISKYVNRNRLGTAAAIAIAIVAGVQQQRILSERDTAQQERDIAQRERDSATAIRDFMIDLFSISNPDEARGNSVTAREMLDRGARKIEGRFGNQPAVRAQLISTMGSVYKALGLYEPATELLHEALKLQREVRDENSIEVAQSLIDLSHLYFDKGQFDHAEPLVRDALGIYGRVYRDDHLDKAKALDLLGLVLRYQGNTQASEPLLREGLRIRQETSGQDSEETAESLNNLAGLLKDKGQYDESILLYRQALDVFRKSLGDSHPDVAMGLNNLALALHMQGSYDEAELLYRDALSRHRQIFTDEHPAVADTLASLGALLSIVDPDSAEPLLNEALAIRQRLLGNDHPRVASTHASLGAVLFGRGDIIGAQRHYESAHQVLSAALGESHWRVLVQTLNLAKSANALGRFEQSESLCRLALVGFESALGADHQFTLGAVKELGAALTGLNRFEEAEKVLLEAHDGYVSTGSPGLLTTREHLVTLYHAWEKPEMAANYKALITANGR